MPLSDVLYPPFAKQWLKGGTVWVYSDPHFGDLESYKLRGVIHCITEKQFNTMDNFTYGEFLQDLVKQADEEQIRRINSKVGKKDTIVILGDVGNVELVKRIRGYKVLIMGNHDKGASNYKRKTIERNGIEEDNHLFDEVYTGCLIVSDRLILSHEPIEGLQPYLFNIHGHDHSGEFVGVRHLNVCAEIVNYTPVNLNRIIENGLLKDVESIHRLTIDKATERKRNG